MLTNSPPQAETEHEETEFVAKAKHEETEFVEICLADQRWPAVRALISAGDECYVELRGLSLKTHTTEGHGYVCVLVEALVASGVVLQMPHAHITLAHVCFEAVPSTKKLRTAEAAVTHFARKVTEVQQSLPCSLWGRLGWNGLEGSPCSFDLRNDTLGMAMGKAADAFQAFVMYKPRLTMPWLLGRTLHLSVYDQVLCKRLHRTGMLE